MALRKSPQMTEEALAARRRNGQRSRGAVTEEGKARAAAANLRHGFYSDGQDGVLRALGEDPDEYDALLHSLHDDIQPVGGLEQELVRRMGASFWRLRRADRMQEGAALQRLEGAVRGAQNIATLRVVPFYRRLEVLRALYGNLDEGPDYRPAESEIVQFRVAFGTEATARTPEIQEILGLLVKLAKPRDRARLKAAGLTRQQFVYAHLNTVTDDEDDINQEELGASGGTAGDDATPPPRLSSRQREAAREKLLSLLSREMTTIEGVCNLINEQADSSHGPERQAGLMAPRDPNDLLLQRMEDSSLRQLWRISNLLIKVRSGGLGRNAPPRESEAAPTEAPPLSSPSGDLAGTSGPSPSGTGDWAAAPSPAASPAASGARPGVHGHVPHPHGVCGTIRRNVIPSSRQRGGTLQCLGFQTEIPRCARNDYRRGSRHTDSNGSSGMADPITSAKASAVPPGMNRRGDSRTTPASHLRGPNTVCRHVVRSAAKDVRNAGCSGNIIENKGRHKIGSDNSAPGIAGNLATAKLAPGNVRNIPCGLSFLALKALTRCLCEAETREFVVIVILSGAKDLQFLRLGNGPADPSRSLA